MKSKNITAGLVLTVFCFSISAQEISGYAGAMPSIIVQPPAGETLWQALAHNRINASWQIFESLRIDAGMRNRIITGSKVMINPSSTGFDNGWLDMSWNLAESNNAVVNTNIDRLFLTFEKNKWKLQFGRQRINWGQTFVWNPNDIFNTYSFFDFDYPERSGGDAFRGAYFHSETSSSELAVSVNHDHKATVAILHRRNIKNIDCQFIAGALTGSDIVAGGALTGDLKGLNFRGELSYFQPVKNLADTTGAVAISAGLDYIFPNSLMLQTEVLYNSMDDTHSGGGLMGLYSAPLSAKNLSICRWNVFAQASYPITSRLKASLSVMSFVDIKSYYAGLSVDCSVAENLDFSFIAQYFSTISGSALGSMRFLPAFVRLKYSF